MIELELCLIEDPHATDGTLVARRSGDAEAVVVSITAPGQPQRYGERVALVDRLSGRGLPCYRSGSTIHTGGYEAHRVVVPHPGHKALLRLGRQVEERGWALAVQDEQQEGVALVELWLATPEAQDQAALVEIDALLQALTDRWAHPPAYPDLAARAGGDVAEHERRTRAYGARWPELALP